MMSEKIRAYLRNLSADQRVQIYTDFMRLHVGNQLDGNFLKLLDSGKKLRELRELLSISVRDSNRIELVIQEMMMQTRSMIIEIQRRRGML